MRVLMLSVTVGVAIFQPTPNCPSFSHVFADMHDGDQKKVSIINGNEWLIQPHQNNQTWEVKAHAESGCNAIINFNVPGRPNPPPVKLTASLWGTTRNYAIQFSDPSGSLGSKDLPLNQWVQISQGTVMESIYDCPVTLLPDSTLVFADMNDGDMKDVTFSRDGKMVIKPHAGKENWVVLANFNVATCSAMIDFNVPGKSAHPPVPLLGTLESVYQTKQGYNVNIQFTDPSGTLGSAGTPLNRWVMVYPHKMEDPA